MDNEYQKGLKQFQEWLKANKGYTNAKLRENAEWTLQVRKNSLHEYKSQYQPCCQAWIDELTNLINNLPDMPEIYGIDEHGDTYDLEPIEIIRPSEY